jgi:hypothetical protein
MLFTAAWSGRNDSYGGSMASNQNWNDEDTFWRGNFSSRPYATGRTYEDFQPGYRYGFESGAHHMGRSWNDVEPDLRTGWDKYQFRGNSAWENVKDAVRDAWHRVTGQKDVDADRMSESNVSNISRGNTL